MTEKSSFNTKLAGYLNTLKRYSQMSLQKKVTELRGLESNKKRLEEELKITGDKLVILDSMPDVAGYRVAKDKIAMGLLKYFENSGSYAELMYFGKSGSSAELLKRAYGAVILSRMELLQTAGLIELKGNGPYPCVTVTERGKAGIKEYAKRK